MVCCSLVDKNCTPGQKDWDSEKSVWILMKSLGAEITSSDPEFLLKVCVFECVCVCVMLSGVNIYSITYCL